MKIWYIHGANATPASFTYIKSLLPSHTVIDVVYDASDPLRETVSKLAEMIDDDIHIVSHSLGGIIAVALSQQCPNHVKTVTTMGTPFGGSDTASKLRLLFPFSMFLRNISLGSPVLNTVRKIGVVVPTLTIVTSAGSNPFDTKKGDGVVSVESQLALSGSEVLHVNLNHFEVLLDANVARTISGFIFNT